MGLVGLLLAIACTNLATWFLVRGLSRAKEVSLRLALGATRGQLVRHLLVESTLLAGAGGAVGCVLAVWTVRLVAQLDIPLNADLGLDYRVLIFTLLLSVATGVAFGLAPALKTTRVTLTPALRAEGDVFTSDRGRFTLQNVLVVAQVALSCVLLVSAGISLERLAMGQTADLGFGVDDLPLSRSMPASRGTRTTKRPRCTRLCSTGSRRFRGRIGDPSAVGVNHDKGMRQLRQARNPEFLESGNVYVMRVDGFKQAKHRFFGKTVISLIPRSHCFEIDEPVDFDTAEKLLASRRG